MTSTTDSKSAAARISSAISRPTKASLEKLRVCELRDELRKRNLNHIGKKAELVLRLHQELTKDTARQTPPTPPASMPMQYIPITSPSSIVQRPQALNYPLYAYSPNVLLQYPHPIPFPPPPLQSLRQELPPIPAANAKTEEAAAIESKTAEERIVPRVEMERVIQERHVIRKTEERMKKEKEEVRSVSFEKGTIGSIDSTKLYSEVSQKVDTFENLTGLSTSLGKQEKQEEGLEHKRKLEQEHIFLQPVKRQHTLEHDSLGLLPDRK